MRPARTALLLLVTAGCAGPGDPVPPGAPPAPAPLFLGLPGAGKQPDRHAAFRGTFDLPAAADVEIQILGAHGFRAWLDGRDVAEGPDRFDAGHPEIQSLRPRLGRGRHVLAVQVHDEGVSTRMLDGDVIPAFLHARALHRGRELAVAWRCAELRGYRPSGVRINPQLGWIEWCDTRVDPPGWREPGFDDSVWAAPPDVRPGLGPLRPPSIAPVRRIDVAGTLLARGLLRGRFDAEGQEIRPGFVKRELRPDGAPAPSGDPADGVWRRYDLGRIRLFRPRFELDLPPGAAVEIAAADFLADGRVAPFIPLSCGDSCNLDRYLARGGPQTFEPLTPKGGRFVEIHVRAPPGSVRFLHESFTERCYFAEPEGAFACGDPRLERIWTAGVETLRGCAEDAITDCPTRERGQWMGDTLTIGRDVAAAAYADLRLVRRALRQAAWCARDDGLVAGLCPGGEAHLPPYALAWVGACVRYHELTGDRALLEELHPAAVRNLQAFERVLGEEGLGDGLGWVFIDWGYAKPKDAKGDMAHTLHYLAALRAMAAWSDRLGKSDRDGWRGMAQRVEGICRRHVASRLDRGAAGWEDLGYHVTALALAQGIFRGGEEERGAVAAMKRHILRCFPNDPAAPRLAAPETQGTRFLTPYFAHYAFPPLIARGEMDFVLDQYRTCWGWALGGGRTTLLEVFDENWDHCHQWSGSPTAQLTRYVLGLDPRFDLGMNHYVLDLRPGSLPGAKGSLPRRDGPGTIRVEWTREADGVIRYRLETDRPLWIHPGETGGRPAATIAVKKRWATQWKAPPAGARPP